MTGGCKIFAKGSQAGYPFLSDGFGTDMSLDQSKTITVRYCGKAGIDQFIDSFSDDFGQQAGCGYFFFAICSQPQQGKYLLDSVVEPERCAMRRCFGSHLFVDDQYARNPVVEQIAA